MPRSSRARRRHPGRIDAHGREAGTPPPRGTASRCPVRVASGLSSVWSIIEATGPARRPWRGGRSGRAGVEHAAKPVRAAVATAPQWHAHCDGGRRRALGRHHLFGDDLDEPLEIVWIQHVFDQPRRPGRRISASDLQQAPNISRFGHRRAEPDVDQPDRGLGVGQQRRSERHHVGAVVLARVPGDRLVGEHRGADAADLVRGDGRSDARAVDDDPGVRLPRATARDARRRRRDSRRGRAVRSQVVDGEPARRADAGRSRASSRRRCGRCQSPRVGCHPPGPAPHATTGSLTGATTVTRRAVSVSCASGVTWPPVAAPPSAPSFDLASIGLGDDVECRASRLSSTAICGRFRYFSAIVEAVADDELVLDREADVVDLDVDLPPRRLAQETRRAQRLRARAPRGCPAGTSASGRCRRCPRR